MKHRIRTSDVTSFALTDADYQAVVNDWLDSEDAVERLAGALHESGPDSHKRRKCIVRHDIRARQILAALRNPTADEG